jgi:hypothetical protein
MRWIQNFPKGKKAKRKTKQNKMQGKRRRG